MAKVTVHLIYTGGTIGGKQVKVSQRKYKPEIDIDFGPKEFFHKLEHKRIAAGPEIELIWGEHEGKYDLSENFIPRDWIDIARSVLRARHKGANGVVIAHGTDTMVWTASALAFLLRGLDIPVVLTGSRHAISEKGTDAIKNLSDAVFVASHTRMRGVFISFAGSSEAETLVHLGVRARKSQNGPNCYMSVHTRPIARICPRWLFEWQTQLKITNRELLRQSCELNETSCLESDLHLCPDVALIKLYPGLRPDYVKEALGHGVKGVVLEAYDGGTGPACDKTDHKEHRKHSMVELIKYLTIHGIPVFVVSQHDGRVTMDAYGSAVNLRAAGGVPLEDMVTEAAVAKLMWALGHQWETARVKEIMVQNLCGEVTEQ